jgi:hypothetical protein
MANEKYCNYFFLPGTIFFEIEFIKSFFLILNKKTTSCLLKKKKIQTTLCLLGKKKIKIKIKNKNNKIDEQFEEEEKMEYCYNRS